MENNKTKKLVALSVKQMNRLESIGIDISSASMYHFKSESGWELAVKGSHTFNKDVNAQNESVWYLDGGTCHIVPAFTLTDVLDLLPDYMMLDSFSAINGERRYNISNENCGGIPQEIWDEDPLIAAFRMLDWNKTVEIINQ